MFFATLSVYRKGHLRISGNCRKHSPQGSCGWFSSSHLSHVKNSIPFSQFRRLRRLCIDDSNFSFKSDEMCDFFYKRGYPASVVQADHHLAQPTTNQAQNGKRVNSIHPRISPSQLRSYIHHSKKLPDKDSDTGRIFSQPPLISFRS